MGKDTKEDVCDRLFCVYVWGVVVTFFATCLFFPVCFPAPQPGFLSAAAQASLGVLIAAINGIVWPASVFVAFLAIWSKAVLAAMA